MAKDTVKSRQFRIDSMISNFFIFLIIPLIIFLGFKYFVDEVSPEVSFEVLGDNHMMNEMLRFRNHTIGDHSYKWNFGDSTELVQEPSPMHTYAKPGDYEVTLLVDNQFEFQQSIHIEVRKKEKPKVIIPQIVVPNKIYLNTPVTFTCSNSGVSTWAWRLNGHSRVYSRSKSVRLTFSQVGFKKISLVVNGNNEFIVSKDFYVSARPGEISSGGNNQPKETTLEDVIPEDPTIYNALDSIKINNLVEEKVVLSDGELSDMLMKISKKIGDKKKFLKYFSDNNKNLMVRCNDDLITFEELVKDVEGTKIVIKEFTTETRNRTKIVSVTIRYKKKWSLI